MQPSSFQYHTPQTLEEAAVLLARYREKASLLAGGQSLVPAMAARLSRPAHVIDLNWTRGTKRPRIAQNRLSIPLLMRHADFADPVAEGPLGALLAELSQHIGSLSVRTRGTFCGSLGNADPSSEWCLAAVVLDAEIMACSARSGVRAIPAARFFDTMMATVLGDDELIGEVRIPLLPSDTVFGFVKLGPCRSDFGTATALVVSSRREGRLQNVRIGLGGVSDTPRRAGIAEALVEHRVLDERLVRLAADAAAEHLIHGDVPGAKRRRDLARCAVRRALGALL